MSSSTAAPGAPPVHALVVPVDLLDLVFGEVFDKPVVRNGLPRCLQQRVAIARIPKCMALDGSDISRRVIGHIAQ